MSLYNYDHHHFLPDFPKRLTFNKTVSVWDGFQTVMFVSIKEDLDKYDDKMEVDCPQQTGSSVFSVPGAKSFEPQQVSSPFQNDHCIFQEYGSHFSTFLKNEASQSDYSMEVEELL